MTVPEIVGRVIEVVNKGETDAFIGLFSDDGEVDDWGSLYTGKAEIRKWSDRELIGANASFELESATQSSSTASMMVRVGGNGFNGPSRFTFTIENGRIRRMEITAT
jgi:hypothetical protein